MKHRMSFGYFNILDNNIVEVVGDEGVLFTLEMIEECHQFIEEHIQGEFGMLVNRINNYDYEYGAKLSIASYENLKALAFVVYSKDGLAVTESLNKAREMDNWNTKVFSGLELGWQQAYKWLQHQLATEEV